MVANFADLLASASLPEAGVPICLAGNLQLRYEELEEKLTQAEEADERGDSLADGGHARKVAEQIGELEREMREHTHMFKFRAVARQVYRDLVEEHPPREDRRDDEAFGANMSTFPIHLIALSCIDPVMTVEQVGQLAEVLTEGQLMAMFGCITTLNRINLEVPKSAAASAILAKPGQKSLPPALGGSLANGSLAGSPSA